MSGEIAVKRQHREGNILADWSPYAELRPGNYIWRITMLYAHAVYYKHYHCIYSSGIKKTKDKPKDPK
jgi:hypothetical protein